MKRFFSLCIFALAMTIGVSTVHAQEKFKKLDEEINMEAQELQKTLDLDKDQTALIARSMFAREKALVDISTNKSLDEKEAAVLTEKVEMNFKSRLQDILDEEQFSAFSAYQAKKVAKKE